jgi:hypothetical protein
VLIRWRNLQPGLTARFNPTWRAHGSGAVRRCLIPRRQHRRVRGPLRSGAGPVNLRVRWIVANLWRQTTDPAVVDVRSSKVLGKVLQGSAVRSGSERQTQRT